MRFGKKVCGKQSNSCDFEGSCVALLPVSGSGFAGDVRRTNRIFVEFLGTLLFAGPHVPVCLMLAGPDLIRSSAAGARECDRRRYINRP
jgi:hypothetical protein